MNAFKDILLAQIQVKLEGATKRPDVLIRFDPARRVIDSGKEIGTGKLGHERHDLRPRLGLSANNCRSPRAVQQLVTAGNQEVAAEVVKVVWADAKRVNAVDDEVSGGTVVGVGVGDVVFPEQATTIVRPRMATARCPRNDSRLLTARSLLLGRQGAKEKRTEASLAALKTSVQFIELTSERVDVSDQMSTAAPSELY